MDKKVSNLIKDTMHDGEMRAPVKSIKLKVKFAKSKALESKKK